MHRMMQDAFDQPIAATMRTWTVHVKEKADSDFEDDAAHKGQPHIYRRAPRVKFSWRVLSDRLVQRCIVFNSGGREQDNLKEEPHRDTGTPRHRDTETPRRMIKVAKKKKK